MNNSKWHLRLRKLSVKWKIILLSACVFGLSLVAGFAYFAYQSYWLNVTTALSGLMNFTDAKQQGVIRFIDQNKKLALQLANLAEQTDAKTLRSQFQSVVTTDKFRLEEHPFKDEIVAGTRNIPTWNVYHAIDYVDQGVIRVSSDPQREGRRWDKSIDLKTGYSDPYYDGAVPVMTFEGKSGNGKIYVHADARMLTNIVNGEIGNLVGDMGSFYLAGVGKTFDYYIVNKENLLITESRSRPGQFLKGNGSEFPWRTTLQQAGVVCGKNGQYTTNAKCTTGCREAMGFYTGVSGKKMLGASMPFYDSGWTLVVEEGADELLMPLWIVFAKTLVALILIGLLGNYFYRRLLEKTVIYPLRRLQESIEDIEKTQDFNRPINIESGDEIGLLGQAFKRMSQNLGSLYQNLELRVDERTRDLNVANKRLEGEIAERERSESALRESEIRLRATIETTLVAVVQMNSEGVIIGWNKQAGNIFGWSTIEAIGRTVHETIIPPSHREAHLRGLKHFILTGEGPVLNKQLEIVGLHRDGHEFPIELTITPIKVGTKHEFSAFINDITQKKESEELIWQQANFDVLTGLSNRHMFRDRLEQEIRKSARSGIPIALMFIDLDRFKEVNDTLGHDVGDILLIEASRRIGDCVRMTDLVARMGGDEFTVLLTEVEDVTSVERIAQNITRKLATPFQLKEEVVFVSASIGITLYPNDASDIEGLFKNADQAMYVAKEQGRNRHSYFTKSLQDAAQNRLRLINDLRGALAADQLMLYFQPIVEMSTGRIHKAEALIRWLHPERGLVSPVQFIPLAEETGLILEIGDWVFYEAMRYAKRWRTLYDPVFQVSVNKSPVQFYKDGDEHAVWLSYLRDNDIPGQALTVEITEGLLLDSNMSVNGALLTLRNADIRVSIDDFGTGYSSLSYLKKFDIDYLKIDQSFVRHLEVEHNDLVLCEAIIVMAHKLGIKVIAEGVETERQRDMLFAAECDYAQGYLYSRPIPADEFEALLKSELQENNP